MTSDRLAAAVRAEIPLLAGGGCYLDNAAMSLMPQAVIDAVSAYDGQTRGNVGRGVYQWAEEATAHYENARCCVAAAVGAAADEIIFTSGATAALNLLAFSLTENLGAKDAVWLAADNHHSNIVPWQMAAAKRGFTLRWLPAMADGRPDAAAWAKSLHTDRQRPRVLAVAAAANVLGARPPLVELAALARENGALLVVDGAQEVPHGLPDLSTAGADFYAFAGHKCYAPTGIGVLWGRRELLAKLPPFFGGGGMIEEVENSHSTYRPPPMRFEAGTPPVSQAVGLGAALAWMKQWDWHTLRALADDLTEQLRHGLKSAGGRVLGAPQAGDAPIVSFCAEAHPHDICQLLAAHGIAARGGHHCAQPLMRLLHIDGCVRFSIAPYNTAADIDAAVAKVQEALNILT